MVQRTPIHALRIYPLSIPLRKPFEHAAHARQTADPIVVEAELADGTLGYGETLARPYVTGETPEGAVETIRHVMPDYLVSCRPSNFPEALEAIDALPTRAEAGKVITAARAAVELALLDAYSRCYRRPMEVVADWLGLPGLGSPGSVPSATYSAILAGRTAGLRRKARMMLWYGLRDFKLKVGYEDDVERIRIVSRVLGKSLGRTTTLRIDANSAWTLERAKAVLSPFPPRIVACVEQPFTRGDDQMLPRLKQVLLHAAEQLAGEQKNGTIGAIKIMPDESLVTMEDAQRLVAMQAVDMLNIRISKNGGLLPSLRLAHYARQNGLGYQLGCMVGETSILSAAGRRFIESVPGISFVEGSYGRFLLAGDIVDRPLQLGCNGRIKTLTGWGWGMEVRPELLKKYCQGQPVELRL